ncbi:cytidylate kinase [Anaeromassilibacillus sp. An172]|uniref:(d)CMP kinase n=1 Tax=Anaeromassilibacillus sp. An172 TaxID=1965570 RepID=UPI000B37C2DB|nr:(d)CMP kinase [Anaeromassilibacillus sp. An172]OUP79897.1 cytidylate kinase [Anaeromassilibacillus sp. An172]
MCIAVAIDGPAGAGKSSVAKAVGKQLGLLYVDTGALYRTVGLAALRKGVDPSSKAEVEALLKEISVEMDFSETSGQAVLLNGEDVTGLIRTPEVSMTASDISALPIVREYLLGLQRNIAKTKNVIMDGRDIGTVVLPDAQVKIFLTASPESRAERRYKELVEKGEKTTVKDVLRDVIKRDYNDTNRKAAPLRPAEDSVLVDTTNLDFDGSVEAVAKIIRERIS